MCPGLQVFDGRGGQVLFVQLFVDLRQLRHPEAVTVLPENLPDATLDLLRVVGVSFIRAGALIQIQGRWMIRTKTGNYCLCTGMVMRTIHNQNYASLFSWIFIFRWTGTCRLV